MLLKPLTVEKITPFWNGIMKNANVNTIDELKRVDAKELYYAWLKSCKESKFSMPYTFPVYDGVILNKNTFNLNNIPDMPYIIGSTCTDMIPIVLESVNKKWGKYSCSHNSNPCYFYNFNRFLPGDDMGAWHSADLLYIFSTLDFNWRNFEEIDYKISEQISDSICAFVKNCNPNCDSIPQWDPGWRRPMSFCESSACSKWKTRDNLIYTLTGKGKTI